MGERPSTLLWEVLNTEMGLWNLMYDGVSLGAVLQEAGEPGSLKSELDAKYSRLGIYV